MKILSTAFCLMVAMAAHAVIPPYSNDLSSLTGFKTIDANGDGKTFKLSTMYDADTDTYNGYAKNDSPAGGCDDWLVTPAMTLKAGSYYDFSADIRGWSDKWAETFEIYVGTKATLAGMTTKLLDATTIKTNVYRRYTCGFMPPTTGTYYFAIRHCNEAEGFHICVDNISVEISATEQAPSAPTALSVEPDYYGLLKATVRFTTPATTLSGDNISALTKAEIFRDDELVGTINAPESGKEYTFTDTGMEEGYHEYAVSVSSAAGTSPKVTSTRWCGVPLPAATASCRITETDIPGRVTMTWEPVTTDVDGYDLNPELIRYVVILVQDGQMVIKGWLVEGTSFTFDALPEGEDVGVAYGGVYAFTNNYSKTAPGSNTIAIGRSYDLPYEESYADGIPSYLFAAARTAGHGGEWGIASDTWASDVKSQDSDNGFATCKIEYKESSSKLIMGKFNIPSDKVEMRLWYYSYVNEDAESNTIDVWVTDSKGTLHEVATIEQAGNPGQWNEAVIPIEDFENQTVRIELNVTCVSRVYTMIDNISIRSLTDGIDTPQSTISHRLPTTGCHDLQGRRLNAPKKGINIIEGKKIIL